MTRRPLAASRRNPLAVIEPSGYAKTAATARRSGVSSPTSLRAGMWPGFLTSVRPFCYFIEGEHFDRVTPRPAGVTSVFLKIEGRRIGIIQFKCNTAFKLDDSDAPSFYLQENRCDTGWPWGYPVEMFALDEIAKGADGREK